MNRVTELQAEFDTALAGVGKQHRVMVWTGSREKELPMHWGLPSADPEIGEIPLLRSETANIGNPCLILANSFGLVRKGKTLYSAKLVTTEPFFCIAGVWRRQSRKTPDCFAALTVEAYPDLAPHKDRHVAVVDPDDWFDWLMGAQAPLDILRPFPEGSFSIDPPLQIRIAGLLDDL